MSQTITTKLIQEAYSRFKAHVYYDNFNINLRQQLANFEADNSMPLKEKLKLLSVELNDFLKNGVLSERLKNKIQASSYLAVPKSFKIKDGNHCNNKILLTNKNDFRYIIEKSSLLYQGDIEIHLIATLWIILEGVRLKSKIGYDNYGYHLPIDQYSEKLGTQKQIFTKYFDKYQEWRDKGIRAAKNQIDDGNDVMLISLDIKNFFHSTKINFDTLKKDIGLNQKFTLTDILYLINNDHGLKVEPNRTDKHPLLPIGLVSSGVIANWFLSDFDKELKDKMSPVYYGRYVDDIFIVVSNIQSPEFLNKEDDNTETIIKWLKEKYFYNDRPLKIYGEQKDMGFEFSDEKYQGLKIQSEKLKLFYFSPDWPHAMLNKFQKALEENSSAFWFLPDEEEMKDSLDDEAYDMQYEDTINKFRSISDIKASKYGASVFLAKKIKLAILHNSLPDDKITNEVFRFFKGISTLSLYNMWEKVFTYLIVTNDVKSLIKLYRSIYSAINELEAIDHKKQLRESLFSHLRISLQLALSLNPSVLEKMSSDEIIKISLENIYTETLNLRKSLLTRHHYLVYPYIVLTDYYSNSSESLLAIGLFDKLMSDEKFVISNELKSENWRLPRWVHFQEVNSLMFLLEIKKFNKDRPLFYDKSNEEKNKLNFYQNIFISQSIELFKSLNNRDLSHYITCKKYKQYKDTTSDEPRISSDIISIKEETKVDKIKIGLSNFRVFEGEILKAISVNSVTNRDKRIKHIKLLNQAEEEKVDILVLPETSVPLEWLYAYSDEARRKQRAFIFGLEHFTANNFCFNFSICILPFEIGKIKESIIIPRLKNHYSPSESNTIRTYGKNIPIQPTSFYHLIKWRNLQFSLYNCYELTDVVHRSIFRSELDMLFAIEYNRDINYFSNIAESTSRDLHCYFIQANTSDYGDSRVIEPKETIYMNPVRVKGGENNVILRYELDIAKLRNFQIKRLPQQLSDKSFKTTPPDFEHDKVKDRGK